MVKYETSVRYVGPDGHERLSRVREYKLILNHNNLKFKSVKLSKFYRTKGKVHIRELIITSS